MRNPNNALTCLLYLVMAPSFCRADVTLTLTPNTAPAATCSAVTFNGTITNNGSSPVFLNGDSAAVPHPQLTLDDSRYLTNTPASLAANGGSYSGPMFSVTMLPGSAPGTYTGSFAIQGGADSNTFTNLAMQSFTIQLSGAAASPTPTITGAVSASDFGAVSSSAPGSWIEIYGANLAPDNRPWSMTDFNGSTAPTLLDGVSVGIGGQCAFLDYISPTQVNAQLPSNIAIGNTLQLTVSNGNSTSAPYPFTVNAVQPGLFAPASFKVGGNQYVVALLPDLTYVLPAGSIAGVQSRPAKPGETIVIYGIGFGPGDPDFPGGQIATDITSLTVPLQIMFGQTPAQIPYYGFAPNYVGLYQINVMVPELPDSDLVPLTFNLGGAAGTQILYTAVRH